MSHTIGEASKLSGVGIETIRYYEREGVVPRAGRSRSGRRVYNKMEIGRLRFVKRCRELGFSISDIKILLHLSNESAKKCDDVRAIGKKNLELVQNKITDLKRMQAALKELVASCDTGKNECPMLKDLFADQAG